MGHAEVSWEYPAAANFYERIARFGRLVLFDRRGTGLSDPIAGPFDIDDRLNAGRPTDILVGIGPDA